MIIKSEVDLVTIIASELSIIGAFFLVRSIIFSGAKEIASMSGTYIGSNPHLESSLVKQKADSVVGFSLTLLSGCTWLLTAFFSYYLATKFEIWAWLVVFGTALVIISFYVSKNIFEKMNLKVRAISFVFHVESYIQHNPKAIDVEILINDAKNAQLASLFDEKLDSYSNLARVLRFAGANPGADYILTLKNNNKV